MIGTQQVARAKPDGYTIMMGTIGTHGTNAAVYKNVPYDTIKDFDPVVIVASTPNVMVANKDAPSDPFAEFLAYARKHPGTSAVRRVRKECVGTCSLRWSTYH